MSDLAPDDREKIIDRIAELDAKLDTATADPISLLEWVELYHERRRLRELLGESPD